MTLIAYATYPNRVEFITDTASYTRHAEKLGKTTKHLTLNHLDAAILASGGTVWGDHVFLYALQVAEQVPTFDDLVSTAQEWLQLAAEHTGNKPEGTVCLLGWSETQQAWTGYVCAAEDEYRPTQRDTYMQPTPWSLRPTALESARMQSWMAGAPILEKVTTAWEAKPEWPAPTRAAEWIKLAEAAREERTGEDFAHVVVHGDLVHTRLRRSEVTTRTIHRFADDPDTMRRMLNGTRHPIGQMQECWCESGDTFRDCHLRPYWTDPCGCGTTERTFYECCMVPDSVPVPVA